MNLEERKALNEAIRLIQYFVIRNRDALPANLKAALRLLILEAAK